MAFTVSIALMQQPQPQQALAMAGAYGGVLHQQHKKKTGVAKSHDLSMEGGTSGARRGSGSRERRDSEGKGGVEGFVGRWQSVEATTAPRRT